MCLSVGRQSVCLVRTLLFPTAIRLRPVLNTVPCRVAVTPGVLTSYGRNRTHGRSIHPACDTRTQRRYKMKQCSACTLENLDSALVCTACGSDLPDDEATVACPMCTLKNHASASICEACGEELPQQPPQRWACISCGDTEEALSASGQAIVWLPCAHRACVTCHELDQKL